MEVSKGPAEKQSGLAIGGREPVDAGDDDVMVPVRHEVHDRHFDVRYRTINEEVIGGTGTDRHAGKLVNTGGGELPGEVGLLTTQHADGEVC